MVFPSAAGSRSAFGIAAVYCEHYASGVSGVSARFRDADAPSGKSADPFLDLTALSQGRPILGLLVQPWQGCDAQSLLAQVREIDFVREGVEDGAGRRRRDRKVILELIILDSMQRIQNTKVTQLLQALAVL